MTARASSVLDLLPSTRPRNPELAEQLMGDMPSTKTRRARLRNHDGASEAQEGSRVVREHHASEGTRVRRGNPSASHSDFDARDEGQALSRAQGGSGAQHERGHLPRRSSGRSVTRSISPRVVLPYRRRGAFGL